MCGYKEKFVELEEKVRENVSFGYSSKVQIQEKCTILISLKDGSHKFIKDVYYVSKLRSNIFSFEQLVKKGYEILMKENCLWLKDQTSNLHKSKTFVILKIFKALVEKESDYVIKALRSNRGGVFTSKEFNKLCEKNGICCPLMVPRTPQQNGVAERKNRTILNMARCMLKVKSMPKEFCDEVVSCAECQRSNTSRSMKWSGVKPKVDHFRVFGSITYTHVPNQARSKLNDRSVKHVFIGYCSNSKGYKLYNPNNGKMIVIPNEFSTRPLSPTPSIHEASSLEGSLNERTQKMRSIQKIYDETKIINDLFCLFVDNEHLTFDKVMKEKRWRQAMEEEIKAIKKNDT
ncbi:hypothetical protein CR513_16853, partial [Mucuna pruriens]